jgi:hypothetical protein
MKQSTIKKLNIAGLTCGILGIVISPLLIVGFIISKIVKRCLPKDQMSKVTEGLCAIGVCVNIAILICKHIENILVTVSANGGEAGQKIVLHMTMNNKLWLFILALSLILFLAPVTIAYIKGSRFSGLITAITIMIGVLIIFQPLMTWMVIMGLWCTLMDRAPAPVETIHKIEIVTIAILWAASVAASLTKKQENL